jgi:hypothetical protein
MQCPYYGSIPVIALAHAPGTGKGHIQICIICAICGFKAVGHSVRHSGPGQPLALPPTPVSRYDARLGRRGPLEKDGSA